jgi:hypothetical protein
MVQYARSSGVSGHTWSLPLGLRSYGAMVAGCTGAVIAMAGYNILPGCEAVSAIFEIQGIR